jgi:hypothetical protein
MPRPLLLTLGALCACFPAPAPAVHLELDVKSFLPADVVPPDSAATTEHADTVRLGSDSVATTIHWRTFMVDSSAYIYSASFDAPADSRGRVFGAAVDGDPVNRGTRHAAIEELPLRVTWYRKAFGNLSGGGTRGTIDGIGSWRVIE